MTSDLEALADSGFVPVGTALSERRIPGAVLGLITPKGDRAVRFGGAAQLVPEQRPISRETVFDLASLTKVMVTVPALLRLVESGRIDLDDPLWKHLPDLASDRPDDPVAGLTLRQLAVHQSGLPATAPIWQWEGDAEFLRNKILAREWPLADKVYSDINYILLGLVLESVTGRRLSETPVGDGLTFTPEPAVTAATEECAWRRRILRGEIHDESAAALEGAGHAGLFGTIDGVLGFAKSVMDDTLMSPAAIDAMRRPQTASRALGWEIPYPGWTGGSLTSESAIGHLGFTGVGLWIDAERHLAWALLTNRVHPSRHIETGIMDLRRSVSNRIATGWRG